ncbi:histidine phosphatase family protein [Sporocytophaga myxococcoides]|uniref:histidine phosphatase family protein n=1 Tax=Sporocytophaga myxococcoides TaxID=153721 RepID=UPI0003F8D56E|nr:phosphoglycerate mutase family protein [Sporocytophaga myxococcoides]
MRIGLVRHFKVNQPFPNKFLLSKGEVIKWFAEYDNTKNIEYKNVDLSQINWQHCYSSPMIRAVGTANHIYNGPISEITELKELDILHLLSDKLKLPFIIWAIIVRIKSFSSNKDTNEFKSRIVDFLDNVIANNESNVLIVSHWFVMRVIRKELIKRGLSGDNFKSKEYGTLYVYERRVKQRASDKL